MLMGKSQHNVDAKGRVFLPARFRPFIAQTLVVCCGRAGCINFYLPDKWEEIIAKLSQLGAKSMDLRRRLLMDAGFVELDSQGRFMLPAELRERVGITDKVAIVGQIDFFEVWKPESLDAKLAEPVDEQAYEDMLDAAQICL